MTRKIMVAHRCYYCAAEYEEDVADAVDQLILLAKHDPPFDRIIGHCQRCAEKRSPQTGTDWEQEGG